MVTVWSIFMYLVSFLSSGFSLIFLQTEKKRFSSLIPVPDVLKTVVLVGACCSRVPSCCLVGVMWLIRLQLVNGSQRLRWETAIV